MARPRGANATVAWLRAHGDPNAVAGAAFLVANNLAFTCAHVVRDHLGLEKPTPRNIPRDPVRLCFEALSREVTAHVADSGWWSDGGNGALDDVAVLRLEDPIEDLDCAGLALSSPRPQESCYIYGAESGYQGIGQTVLAQLAANPGARGWRQLNARPGQESGYFIRRGFSGSPVLDELGNTIWGMVATVETEVNKLVAFAIPAEDLREASKAVIAAASLDGQPVSKPKDHISDSLDELGRDALATLLVKIQERLAQQQESIEGEMQPS